MMSCYDHLLDMPGCRECEANNPRRLKAKVEQLRAALDHVEQYHQPMYNRCCDDFDKNVYGYIRTTLAESRR
jgi:hypothetical protein